MQTDFKPGAKMSLTKQPPLPGKCINCEFSADGKREFLDTGASEEYYGAIMFCIDCAREMAVSLGFITPFQRDKALQDMEDAVVDSVLAKEKLKAIENVISEYGLNNLDDLIDSANLLRNVSDESRAEAESRSEVPEKPSNGSSESTSKF